MILIKEFEFDAAHNLIHYHGKCERLHGHTYKLVVKLEGQPDKEDMIYDFTQLKKLVKEEILEQDSSSGQDQPQNYGDNNSHSKDSPSFMVVIVSYRAGV